MGPAQSPSGTIWTGHEDVNNKTVVLHFEQCLGDTLQFIRYANLLCDRGARATAVVQAPLLRLLRSSDSRIHREELVRVFNANWLIRWKRAD
jgi:hypothetical protein